ncbi:MAG: hypothetical protein GWP10_01475 [Nitrospiraceae bacterium]|nr:hypothetical protein [Nitrospiraceae bacterium]
MQIETVQDINSISPPKNRIDFAGIKPAKTPVHQDKLTQKDGMHKPKVSSSLLNQVQENLKIIHDVSFQFSVHKATGQTIVKIIDQETGKVIREIPPKQVLDLAARIDEMIGILFNTKV